MYKVAIVILNYLNYEDTIECVESLNNDKYINKEVIVVDNNSNNESWSELNKKYKDSKVHLLKTSENLGFARGNNLGIKFARENLKCNFVLLVNNDTIFQDSNLIVELISNYENGVAVIGPKIIAANGFNQNPVDTIASSERIELDFKLYSSFRHNIVDSRIYNALKQVTVLRNIKKMLFNRKRGTAIDKRIVKRNLCHKDLVLHGSCIMLTEDYFKKYPYLFPKTFLYYEENILSLLVKKVDLKCKYVDDAYIYHKEDQSSEMSFKNVNSIKSKYLLESINYCKDMLDESYSDILSNYFTE